MTADRDVYLVLAETAHGQRFWRTYSDVTLAEPYTLAVFGPAIVGPNGYASDAEAAEAMAVDFDLDDSSTWPIQPVADQEDA